MNLPDYVSRIGDVEAARRWRVAERTVASWRRGERRPRAGKAREIVADTGGEVSYADIYGPRAHREEKKSIIA